MNTVPTYSFRFFKKAILLTVSAVYITACHSVSNERSDVAQNFKPVKIGLLPDTQGSGAMVSIYPMEAVLKKFQDMEVDIVIPVGDLTNHGTPMEFEQWTQTAEKYRDAGIEFLPLMGNHERSFAYMVDWIDYMKEYIPEDAVHMSGAQYLNYYVVRENVLIIALKYYHLPVAFQWIKGVVASHLDEIDHIVMASHDGLVGAKYGQTREKIVEGTKGNNLLLDQWDEIRAFFSKHDVIWVQGHEHMYQRSVISAPIDISPTSWTPSDGNYRLPQYTQIVAGNASYKGYEFRYGERELIQTIIQQKMNTMENGSEALDANASMLTFDNSRVDYASYFVSHTVVNNDEGKKELADPDWVLMDTFSRTTNRCERLVFANTIPEATRPVMYFDSSYRTNECFADDGSKARLLDGVNNTFNRVDSTPQTLSWRPGFSRAESQMDLVRLAYQYMFRDHRPWDPNLNRNERVLPADDEFLVEVPPTTIDLKEHITLSWLPKARETISDILIVSGTQVQSGVYSGAYGEEKDIETDTGHDRSQPDGTAKQPHTLPVTATKSWDAGSAVADLYTLQFDGGRSIDSEKVTLGFYKDGNWKPFTIDECVIRQAYDTEYLHGQTTLRSEICNGEPMVGYDSSYGNRWWVVLNSDAEVALIEKE
jgi:hypothetical protein